MTRFLTTTALVAALAMPVYAQQSSDTNAQQNNEMRQEQMDSMGIMASNLIGKRLFMEREGQMGDQMGDMENRDSSDTMDSQGLAGDQSTDMAESGSNADMADDEGATEMAEGDTDSAAENNLEAAGQELADAASETGQAIENTAEDAGQEIAEAAESTERAVEEAGNEFASEVADIPENWQMVADIDDVVITDDGTVTALIVDAGGFLGIGETERRIDLENVSFVRDSDDEGEYYVVFTGDRALFEEQGSYDEADAQSRGELRATEQPEMQDRMAEMESEAPSETLEWGNVTTEELLGSAVYGKNDEWIGDLSELNIASDGNIDGVIVDVGGFLGLGEKPVQLTLDQVTLQRVRGDEIRAYVNATEEELESLERWSGGDM